MPAPFRGPGRPHGGHPPRRPHGHRPPPPPPPHHHRPPRGPAGCGCLPLVMLAAMIGLVLFLILH